MERHSPLLTGKHRELERAAEVCEEPFLEPVLTDIRDMGIETSHPLLTGSLDSFKPPNHSEPWASRYHRLCPLSVHLPNAIPENTGPPHVADTQKRDFAILQCLQWSVSIASAHCKHSGPGSQLRNCGFGVQFQQRSPGATRSMMPATHVQPALLFSSCWGRPWGCLLIGPLKHYRHLLREKELGWPKGGYEEGQAAPQVTFMSNLGSP